MQLYESNYLRLRALCGDPARLAGERLSHVERGCSLRVRVLERSAYTVTLNLTHLFGAGREVPAQAAELSTYPDVMLSVYCDARLVQAREWAEAVPAARGAACRAGDRELHQRWTYNIMLNKWLEYCLELGHRLG
ncbi:MAG: DUF1249 domain-containing protein [Steroidobacteraceae bacterium]